MKNLLIYSSIILLISQVSCNGSKDEDQKTAINKKVEPKVTVAPAQKKGPIINIIDTVEIRRKVICVKDSAATTDLLKEKLMAIFNKKLPDAVLLAKLKIVGEPIVWYKSKKAPYFFQAGIPVDKAPAKISSGIFMATTGGDSAYIAHFFGPNELTNVGYDALAEMIKENNKKKTSAPYEIYKDNQFLETTEKKDPYRLMTDIVMPYKK